jgi:glutaredoxin
VRRDGRFTPACQTRAVTRLTLISRTGCHLCEVAEETLERIAPGDWTRVEVEDSIELERDYGDRVPVLLLDGKEHGYWRIEEERLRRDIARPPGAPRL